MNDSEKESIIQKLYEFQPFLTEINNHENRLQGFNNLLELSIKDDLKNIENFSNIFDTFSESLQKKNLLIGKIFFHQPKKNSLFFFGIKTSYLKDYGFTNINQFLNDLKKKESENIKN